MKGLRRRALPLLVAPVVAWPAASHAVRLADDGMGQALIYPYYTVQQANGDAYNTYLSIVNHTADAKALRVRFREGRASRETFSLNLFLAPHDTWTGALVPDDSRLAFDLPPPGPDPVRLITADISCTSPALPATGLPFQNTMYSGASDDGNGTGLDRAREGYVEVIEMATLGGADAAAVTPTNAGPPVNCAAVQGDRTLQVAAPTGGLSGTLTLINVQNGLNFDLNAVALADLSTTPFYRPPNDAYPDFNAAEIDPVSLVLANGAAYRATWSRPADAVSAVLMHDTVAGEYVLDDGTQSNTDVVLTFPTRQFYVTPASSSPPFSYPSTWHADCTRSTGADEEAGVVVANREATLTAVTSTNKFDAGFGPASTFCAASVVFDISDGSAHTAAQSSTRVLGSLTRGYGYGTLPLRPLFDHGWLRIVFDGRRDGADTALTSLPSSVRMDLATGATATGPQAYHGLPAIGFTARTFVNGTLACSAGACQGNYGGAFPFQYTRKISP